MKKIFSNACFILHVFVLAVAEIFAIGFIAHSICERINCSGFTGLLIVLSVAAVWLVTYVVFAKRLERP